MLLDNVRNRAFKEAIFRNVKKDDVVIDLGSGTGILAIWAAQAGAKRVYAIEETDVADVAEEVIRDNGFQEVITVLKANSSEVTLPEPADVLIAELVGHFLFEEGIVEAISEAREGLLKASGKVIPSWAAVFVAPVELNCGFDEIRFWSTWKDPVLSAVRKKAANTAYVHAVKPSALIGSPAKLFDIDFTVKGPDHFVSKTVFAIERSGALDAIAGWFRLSLDENNYLETAPWGAPTHWQQCIFPLEEPFELAGSETIEFQMEIESFVPGSRWHWEIRELNSGQHEVHDFPITYGQGSRLLAERF